MSGASLDDIEAIYNNNHYQTRERFITFRANNSELMQNVNQLQDIEAVMTQIW